MFYQQNKSEVCLKEQTYPETPKSPIPDRRFGLGPNPRVKVGKGKMGAWGHATVWEELWCFVTY